MPERFMLRRGGIERRFASLPDAQPLQGKGVTQGPSDRVNRDLIGVTGIFSLTASQSADIRLSFAAQEHLRGRGHMGGATTAICKDIEHCASRCKAEEARP